MAVPSLGRGDEIGQMAGAVQTFKDAAIEKERMETEAVAQRRQVEAERTANEAARAEAARQQEAVVSALADGLDNLSRGDLVYRLDMAFAPEYEKLRADFNAAMEKLQQTMATVASNAGSIQAGSGEISKAADDLSAAPSSRPPAWKRPPRRSTRSPPP
ncbi:MAG: methyl-accepting chemotaxis protein [Caulobacteraceae bacterium]